MTDDKLRAALMGAAEEAHVFGPDHDRRPIFECSYEPCRQRRATLARPAAPVALDAGTYEELLASRDALQDDYNALSDEHDKCPAVPEALDVDNLERAMRAHILGKDGWPHWRGGPMPGDGPQPIDGCDDLCAAAIAREYAALQEQPE